MKERFLLITILFGFALSACVGMPITSIWKLVNLDLDKMDPEQLKIAVISDQSSTLEDGAVTISVGFTPQLMQDKSYYFTRKAHAVIDTDADESELVQHVGKDQNITLFYLPPASAEQVRRGLNQQRMIKDQDIDGNGLIKIDVKPACLPTPRPEQILATVYIKYRANQDYFLIKRDIDLLEIDRISDQPQVWRDCVENADPA